MYTISKFLILFFDTRGKLVEMFNGWSSKSEITQKKQEAHRFQKGVVCFCMWNIYVSANLDEMFYFMALTDFPKLAEKLSVIRTDRHEDLVRPKNILPVRKKSPKKFTVMCIMFSLAFLE